MGGVGGWRTNIFLFTPHTPSSPSSPCPMPNAQCPMPHALKN
ncbi:MAG: hypothetical protein RMY29_014030 [Nostoc sp. CreGUA01]|nr:hypothetical protein [Nostoc sp. CreGUA01]